MTVNEVNWSNYLKRKTVVNGKLGILRSGAFVQTQATATTKLILVGNTN